MDKTITTIPINSIILDENIYPRKGIDHGRVGMFAENIRDDWPGRIPAQLIAHIFFYFSKPNDLVLDPMAGGGVTCDTCLALNRRCWAFDIKERPETRPEIEPHIWTLSTDQQLTWPARHRSRLGGSLPRSRLSLRRGGRA